VGRWAGEFPQGCPVHAASRGGPGHATLHGWRAAAWALVSAAGLAVPPAHAIDLQAHRDSWDFRDPSASEARFRAALDGARADDRLILLTQIARAQGLRRDFDAARSTLRRIEPDLASASREVRVRHALEWGRTWASTVHPRESQTASAVDEARRAWQRAHELALADPKPDDPSLDGLAVDALHMMVTIEPAPPDQLGWNRKALAVVEASNQPEAKAWEASLRQNAGHSLRLLGRHDEALAEFARVRELRERRGQVLGRRIADWMTARTWRDMGRLDEALALQHRLEAEWAAAGGVDEYVFEELAALYEAKGQADRAREYRQKQREAASRSGS
jgi:tetratricopeptide (TPR) repeat protein